MQKVLNLQSGCNWQTWKSVYAQLILVNDNVHALESTMFCKLKRCDENNPVVGIFQRARILFPSVSLNQLLLFTFKSFIFITTWTEYLLSVFPLFYFI